MYRNHNVPSFASITIPQKRYRTLSPSFHTSHPRSYYNPESTKGLRLFGKVNVAGSTIGLTTPFFWSGTIDFCWFRAPKHFSRRLGDIDDEPGGGNNERDDQTSCCTVKQKLQ